MVMPNITTEQSTNLTILSCYIMEDVDLPVTILLEPSNIPLGLK